MYPRLYLQHMPRARAAVRSFTHGRRHGNNDAPRSGTRRIIIDLKELKRFETLLDTSRNRAEHSNRVVRDVAGDLALATSTHAYSQYLNGLFTAATGPFGLPMVVRHLEWETRLVQRIRRLSQIADGANNRYGPEDLVPFLNRAAGHKIGLPEAAVLHSLITAIKHPQRPDRPRVPAHPRPQQLNLGNIVPPALRRFANGKLPASVLTGVGEGEKLATVAAKHFRRMDAAARAAGVDLRVTSGYRSFAEQARIDADYERRGIGHLAAPAGHSNHGWGLSADLDVRGEPRASPWLHANAARYGFFNDVQGEPWHWTYRPR